MYTVEQNEQAMIFFTSLGVGFLLGVLYDVMRAFRLSFDRGKAVTVIIDLLYFSLVAFCSYVYILAANKGEVRSYIIAGELIGAVFYYFSLGAVAMKITDRLAAFLKKIRSVVFKTICTPPALLKKGFSCFFRKMSSLLKKKQKNSQKIRKKHLPKLRLYVYNLKSILYAGKTSNREDGAGLGKEEKEKK